MEKNTEKPASLPGQVQPIVSCPVCQRGDIWHEAVNRTEYVYKGEPVKNGQEVIDYLLAEVCSMLEQAANVSNESFSKERSGLKNTSPFVCSAPDPADFIPPWPCQQLHGGRPPYIYQGCDPDTGLCHHEECNPANDDRVPNAESEALT